VRGYFRGRVTSAKGDAVENEGAREMSSNDHDKIAIAREYFIRADQGRPDVLDLLHEDAEIYFPKFGFGFGRQSLFEMVKGFEGILEHI
jgi:hypothetical protein